MVDMFFGSALSPLSVNMVLIKVTGRELLLLSTFTLMGAFTITGATKHTKKKKFETLAAPKNIPHSVP